MRNPQSFVFQAITTQWVGPTNHRPSRIKATCEAGTRFFPWDHSLGIQDNHRAAASSLAYSLGWLDHGEILVAGGIKNGYTFVRLATGDCEKIQED